MVASGEPPPGGDLGHDRVYGSLGRGVELHIIDPSALDTHQMVMMLLERFGQLVSSHAIATVMGRDQLRFRKHTQSAIDGGERNREVQVSVDFCRRDRSTSSGEGLDDISAT